MRQRPIAPGALVEAILTAADCVTRFAHVIIRFDGRSGRAPWRAEAMGYLNVFARS